MTTKSKPKSKPKFLTSRPSSGRPRMVMSVRIDPSTHRQLGKVSKQRRHRSMSETVELAIQSYIND